ncbi:NAD(P)H-dependent oxidoreductase [Parvicella tangerina]|uniref:FMN-dependent NADH-azoreductase n=1 Tax=Parvicella tangerina TaxID=2829795 RepID=A0A916JQS0_9FLAO|nr:NAD(P)H-dependent oxidoreductase [Parvicella tangerina]CAG5087766.1 FMN-dependent NADH-azoreductase [Parvicella tangerina]
MKILIINGHPNTESFNYALHKAFKNGVLTKGKHSIEEINIAKLNFNLNLSKGYSSGITMETDLINAQNKIKNADHIVWIYPLWWSMMPTIMKGFIDRVFVPGFAFKYHPNSSKWDKLLKGKTTEIIATLDTPVFIFKLFLGEGGVKVFRKSVLGFCGIKTTRTTYIGPIKPSTPEQRKNWLQKVELMGQSKK